MPKDRRALSPGPAGGVSVAIAPGSLGLLVRAVPQVSSACVSEADRAAATLSPLADRLRCLECGGDLALDTAAAGAEQGDGAFVCGSCGHRWPLVDGTVRMLAAPEAANGRDSIHARTATSFAYEWEHFGAPRTAWAKNFADYMQPGRPEDLDGCTVLDVGTGSGRHAAQAAAHGAHVAAVDLGASIDVARRNVPDDVLTVQADAERLPFEPQSFDFVMSLGVLHHLPDTEHALRNVARYARPGGLVHVYLYWVPERHGHRILLAGVTAVRRATVRMPHRLLHLLCYPLAAALHVLFVLPQRALREAPHGRRLAAALPLKTYADYPFGVLVNDQFDRFSAPLERRFTRAQVAAMLEDAGLEEVTVVPNHGWVARGRVPREGAEAAQAARAGISVVIPVLNDPEGLELALAAVARQTRQADEVVVVDGGSEDGTRLVAERWASRLPITVLERPGSNIPEARNAGAAAARHAWIASTDAGCAPAPQWLEELESAGRRADFVAGVVRVEGETPFERVVAATHYPAQEELNGASRLVRLSHRLFGRRYERARAGGAYIAYKRSVWRAVGGFPESIPSGEDRGFTGAVVAAGFKTARAPHAEVTWSPPGSWQGNARMFFRYARGDIKLRGRGRHLVRLLAWAGAGAALAFGRTERRAAVAAGAAAYVALPVARCRRRGIPPQDWWRIPLVAALKDLAQIAGAAAGLRDMQRARRS